ncbi:MAG: hypothetical protein CVU38_18945 [Chloroflexi bacterium HGW-Chloroflexi-1]|nr:MAG: hypothetical protein CVU38_18945 [Chloroflexi bacterium HGW-Chloroflexi-1]
MKLLDIAFKDLLRAFRSAFLLVMMFGAPLLMTGIFYLAFGGLASGSASGLASGDEGGFDLPVTKVQVVNPDQPAAQYGGFSAGGMLVQFLQNEALQELVQTTVAPDEASARAAVDARQAALVLIIPPGFTAGIYTPDTHATITLYQDPTLTLGPGIVKGLVGQFLDGFSGSKIALGVTEAQLRQRGEVLDSLSAEGQKLLLAYSAWAQKMGESQSQGTNPLLDIQAPPTRAGQGAAASQSPATLVGLVMAGMLIFFVFFTGAGSAESLLTEDEQGTLSRLFTTPTPRSVILGGKFVSVFLTTIVQVIVLLVASALAFGIRWGQPLAVALVALGMVVAAAGFGVLLISFLRSSRQAGPVMGVVLTLTGMLGGLFTTGIADLPAAFNTVNLFTPHGWALRGWKLALAGAGPAEVLLPVLVMLAMGTVFFAVGVGFFRKRFA